MLPPPINSTSITNWFELNQGWDSTINQYHIVYHKGFILTTSQSLSLNLDVQSTACLLSRWLRETLEKNKQKYLLKHCIELFLWILYFIEIRNVIQNAVLVKHVQRQNIQWKKQRNQQPKSLDFRNWDLDVLCIKHLAPRMLWPIVDL